MSNIMDFKLQRILSQDHLSKSIALLGSLDSSPAVLRLEKSSFPTDLDLTHWLKDIKLDGSTDIYSWFQGIDNLKISLIHPATETHITKYSSQQISMIKETPLLFQQITLPYIKSIPPARTQWLTDILSGISEADKILFKSDQFIILPDMKSSPSTGGLYLLAIATDPTIHCLRDLTSDHLPLLNAIKEQSHILVSQKWGMQSGSLRLFIHYQPSYYHFHVHIVAATSTQYAAGMAVGQAHLLDDVISLLELDGQIMNKISLTYGLGDQHPLFNQMVNQ